MSDQTLVRNYSKQIVKIIKEYELVKQGKHGGIRFVSDLFKIHHIPKQNFFKLYHRYQQLGFAGLTPQKRGRKFGTIQTIPMVRNKITELRSQGFGRYEIYDMLLPQYGRYTPSPSTIYRILKANNLNRLTIHHTAAKRKIIKQTAGEMAHIDAHQLKRGSVEGINKVLYIIGVIDDYSRVCAVDVVENIQSLTVGLSVLKLLTLLKQNYGIHVQEILSDNGSEFKGAFDVILHELHIKHRRTRPYRPQTNGKIERFWKTLEEEVLRETVFKDRQTLEESLFNYMLYYNHVRHHQGIATKPIQLLSVTQPNPSTKL